MKKLVIAFDIDGTLRCNCTDTCKDVNHGAYLFAFLLRNFTKNVKIIAWSGGGKDYAQSFIDSKPALKALFGTRCYSKLDAPHVDIAFDDQQEFGLADKNIIVRMK